MSQCCGNSQRSQRLDRVSHKLRIDEKQVKSHTSLLDLVPPPPPCRVGLVLPLPPSPSLPALTFGAALSSLSLSLWKGSCRFAQSQALPLVGVWLPSPLSPTALHHSTSTGLGWLKAWLSKTYRQVSLPSTL